MRGHGSQWFSHKIINRHPLQLKKSKSWEHFGSPLGATRILIFSIAMGAECLSYLKSIETHARAFLTLISLSIDTVSGEDPGPKNYWMKFSSKCSSKN